jgi:hypothetical protein
MQNRLIGLLVSVLPATSISAQRAFPNGALSSNERWDEIRSDWYSEELRVLQEPSLWREARRADETVYRFLWLRAFHAPLCVCLRIHGGSAAITFKEGKYHGAGETGKLLQTRTTPVSQERVAAFLKKVVEVHFWSIPSPNK